MQATKTIHINSFKYFYPERPRLLHVNQPLFESLSQNPAVGSGAEIQRQPVAASCY